MNKPPPSPDPYEDVDDLYRRASAADPSRPGETVRRTVLAHATQLAADRARASGGGNVAGRRGVARPVWWRPAVFGTLAAAAIAGLIIAPVLIAPRAPSVAPAPEGAAPQVEAKLLLEEPKEAPAPEAAAQVHGKWAGKAPAAAASPPAVRAGAAAAAAPPPVASVQSRIQRFESVVVAGARREAAPPAAPSAPPEPASLRAQDAVGSLGSSLAAESAARAALAGSPSAPVASDPGATLRHAAEVGDIAALEGLIGQPVDLDARDAAGRTALMLATLHGQTDAVEVLLAHGADPNAADARGTTPLQAARASGRAAVVTMLQRHGAR